MFIVLEKEDIRRYIPELLEAIPFTELDPVQFPSLERHRLEKDNRITNCKKEKEIISMIAQIEELKKKISQLSK